MAQPFSQISRQGEPIGGSIWRGQAGALVALSSWHLPLSVLSDDDRDILVSGTNAGCERADSFPGRAHRLFALIDWLSTY